MKKLGSSIKARLESHLEIILTITVTHELMRSSHVEVGCTGTWRAGTADPKAK